MPSITPENVGMVKPTDLLGALGLFEAQYGGEE